MNKRIEKRWEKIIKMKKNMTMAKRGKQTKEDGENKIKKRPEYEQEKDQKKKEKVEINLFIISIKL